MSCSVSGLCQKAGAVGAEAGGGVVHREPEQRAGVETAPTRDHAAQPLPVGDRAAGHVARTDGEVGAALDRGHELGEHRGVVGEVGVHLDHDVVPTREADAEPGAVRRSEARLLRAAQHVDTAEDLAELNANIVGSIEVIESYERAAE